jgi:hypothetical protein
MTYSGEQIRIKHGRRIRKASNLVEIRKDLSKSAGERTNTILV